MAINFLRAHQAQKMTGYPRSSFYAQIAKGLLPTPISIGIRAVAWIESELNAVNMARIRGETDEAIQALVAQLIANRGKEVNHE